MKRVLPTILIVLFLSGMFITPVSVNGTLIQASDDFASSENIDSSMFESSQFIEREIRVALYNETNTTLPSYDDAFSFLENNHTAVYNILVQAGFQVTVMTATNIINHELRTADFDVFVLSDQLPRENITDFVKEFWLGGGGILSFDSSAVYLNYAGILPREAETSSGYGVYWNYLLNSVANVSARHPVTKEFQVDDQLSYDNANYAMYDWTALLGTSMASDIVKLAVDDDDSNDVVALAADSTDKGGRVVQIGVPVDPWSSEWNAIVVDALEWLSPIPKGRILYDLSHLPHVGVDLVDIDLIVGGIYSWPWRNDLVSMRYTFDKLYPSSAGNLTPANLAPYDILIISISVTNFTSAEITAVEEWVSAGGGLVLIGEASPVVFDDMENINRMAQPYGMQIKAGTYEFGTFNSTFPTPHPITESVTSLETVGHGGINTTGDADPIFFEGGDAVVTVSEFGEGRVILTDDRLIFDNANYFNADNRDFGKNIVNWVSASKARVLAYVDTASHDPNNNVYRGPVSQALNDLGIPFYLTFDGTYFNLSLTTGEWDLVIVDNINWQMHYYGDDILDYMMSGGKLIFSTWMFSHPANTALMDYLGVKYEGPNFSPPPDIYLWDTDHPMFNLPVQYGADDLSTSEDFSFGLECQNLTVFDNATALAGLSPSSSTTNVSIALGAEGRAIVNGMLLTMYWSDTDDSTYVDAVELWENEIAYMMPPPEVDSPLDIEYEAGTVGHDIFWHPESWSPDSYAVSVDSSEQAFVWDGSMIEFNADGLDPGVHTIVLTVFDSVGYSESDEVLVTVVDTTPPDISSPPDATMLAGTIGNDLSWTCFDLYPDTYTLYVNGTVADTGAWNGGNIDVVIDNLELGAYNYTLEIVDESGNSASDTIIVNAIAAPGIDSTTLILIVAALAAILIIGAIVCLKKRSGGE